MPLCTSEKHCEYYGFISVSMGQEEAKKITIFWCRWNGLRSPSSMIANAEAKPHGTFKLLRSLGIDSKELIPLAYALAGQSNIFKRLWSPGIDSKEFFH